MIDQTKVKVEIAISIESTMAGNNSFLRSIKQGKNKFEIFFKKL